jgi:tRNA A58 N-methylase Trm61
LAFQGTVFAPYTHQFLVEAGLKAGMRVLDVGSGSGDVSFLAADLVGSGGHVLGVDRSPTAVERARSRAIKAKTNDLMIQVSAEVNILAESSKLGRRCLTRVGTLQSVHRLITDKHASAVFLAALRRSDVEVLLASMSSDSSENAAGNAV